MASGTAGKNRSITKQILENYLCIVATRGWQLGRAVPAGKFISTSDANWQFFKFDNFLIFNLLRFFLESFPYLATTVLIVSTQVSSSFWSDVQKINIHDLYEHREGSIKENVLQKKTQAVGLVSFQSSDWKRQRLVSRQTLVRSIYKPETGTRRGRRSSA